MKRFKNKLLAFALSSVFLFSSCSLIPQAPHSGGGFNPSGGEGSEVDPSEQEEEYCANVDGEEYLLTLKEATPMYEAYGVRIPYIECRTWIYFTSTLDGMLTIYATEPNNNLYPLDNAESHGYVITYDSGFYLDLTLKVYPGWYDAFLSGYKNINYDIMVNPQMVNPEGPMTRMKLYGEPNDIKAIYYYETSSMIETSNSIGIYDPQAGDSLQISLGGYTNSFVGVTPSSIYQYNLYPESTLMSGTRIYLIFAGNFVYLATYINY